MIEEDRHLLTLRGVVTFHQPHCRLINSILIGLHHLCDLSIPAALMMILVVYLKAVIILYLVVSSAKFQDGLLVFDYVI